MSFRDVSLVCVPPVDTPHGVSRERYVDMLQPRHVDMLQPKVLEHVRGHAPAKAFASHLSSVEALAAADTAELSVFL